MKYVATVLFICCQCALLAQSPYKLLNDAPSGHLNKAKEKAETYKHSYKLKTESGMYVPVLAEYYAKGTGISEYKDTMLYNDSGELTAAYYQRWNNGAWELYAKDTAEYDFMGRLSAFTSVYKNDSVWLADKWLYAYNDNGYRSLTDHYMGQLEDMQPYSREILALNPDGNILEYLYMDWNFNQWVNAYKNIYERDSSDRETGFSAYYWKDSVWIIYSHAVIEYAFEEKESSYLTYNYDLDGNITGGYKYIRTYDENGYDKSTVSFLFYDSVWTRYDSTTYAVNDTGGIIGHDSFNWTGMDWFLYGRYSSVYDEHGDMTAEIRETATVAELENDSRIQYAYDSWHNPVHGEYHKWSGGAWIEDNGYINFPFSSYYGYAVDVEYKFFEASSVSAEDETLQPAKFSLAQNYPNPFNPETKINFSLPQSGKASLKIYDVLGREVMELISGDMSAGEHEASFNGTHLSSGVYIYRLQSGSYTASKKMLLLK